MTMTAGRWIRACCWLLTGIFFAYDLFAWGGLGLTPKLGEQLRQDANLHSPLAATYLAVGGFVVEKVNRVDLAREFAARRFPTMSSADETDRRHVLEAALAAQLPFGTYSYYGAPLLGLLSLALYLRRQKPIRSFGGRG